MDTKEQLGTKLKKSIIDKMKLRLQR